MNRRIKKKKQKLINYGLDYGFKHTPSYRDKRELEKSLYEYEVLGKRELDELRKAFSF